METDRRADTARPDRYLRLGAEGTEEGLYVRFEPGFGLNVYIGHRVGLYDGTGRWPTSYGDREGIGMSIGGWEKLCSLVDEWRAREAAHGASDG